MDTEGHATYVAYNEEKGEQLMGNDVSYFETMFDQYGNATVVDFEQAK